MIWISSGLLLIGIVGMVISWRVDEEQYLSASDSLIKNRLFHPLVRLAAVIYEISAQMENRNQQIHGIRKKDSVREDIRILEPDNIQQRVQEYKVKKIVYILIVYFLGAGLSLILCMQGLLNGKGVVDKLVRNEYGEGDSQYVLTAKISDGKEDVLVKDIAIELSQRDYSPQEIAEYFDEAKSSLMELIRGKNKDLEYVTSNLNLVTSIDDNPVTISWMSNDYSTLNNKGEITAKSIPEEGMLVVLDATISIGSNKEIIQFPVKLYPPELCYEEGVTQSIKDEIGRRDKEQPMSSEIVLPAEISHGGKRLVIKYEEPAAESAMWIFLLCLGLIITIGLGQDKDLHKKVIKRNKEMSRQYPELIGKLVLLLGAGMTIRGAIRRIADGYSSRQLDKKKRIPYGRSRKQDIKKEAYEEMLRVSNEIASGVSEQQAYINLGKRCDDQHYIRLSMLLSQNLTKGSSGLANLLAAESQEAFSERKRNARTLGEEASTKLLGPMIIMLVIVMIVIMIPAFFSFGG